MMRRFTCSLVIVSLCIATLMCGSRATAANTKLYFSHVNDTHSNFDPKEVAWISPLDTNVIGVVAGGYPRVKRQIQLWRDALGGETLVVEKEDDSTKEEQTGHELLFFHGGDTFQGTGYFVLNLGEANRNVLNQMNLDGMVTGNHEYDELKKMIVSTNEAGEIVIAPGATQPKGSNLSNFIANVNFPVFGANVMRTNDPYLGPLTNMLDSKVIDVDGTQVGVFGITLENMDSISSPASDLVFLPEIATASNMVKELEAAGVDKIVMISHVGYNRDQVIAAAVPGIDIVIGGHSHSFLGDFSAFGITSEGAYPTIVTNTDGGKAYVLTAGEHALAAGLFEAEFDDNGEIVAGRGSVTLLLGPQSDDVPMAGDDPVAELETALSSKGNYVWIAEDDALRTYIDTNYKPAVEEAYGEVIAQVPYALLHERVPTDPGGHGSADAPVIAEALATADYGMHIDFALQNGGGVRTDIPSGVYRKNQALLELLIFNNGIWSFDLTGAQTKEVLMSVIKHSIENPDNDGCFPYTGRLRYKAYSNFEFGYVEVFDGTNWTAIVDDKVYRVVANSYIASGGDNYDLLGEYAANIVKHTNRVEGVIFTEYVEALGDAGKPLVKMPYETTTISKNALAEYLDFDGDKIADVAVYALDNGTWYILQSSDMAERSQPWGWAESLPVPGDYDGDGLYDVAVFSPENGGWYIWSSKTQTSTYTAWGSSDSVAVPGDYDGDGITDIAVFYPASGIWYILESSTGNQRTESLGWSESIPVPGDYDADGKTDLAVYWPQGGQWYIVQSRTETLRTESWGWSEAAACPGDYDGDGIMDIAVYAPANGQWNILQSSDGKSHTQNWGWNAAWPVPADYSGDSQWDTTVYWPEGGSWMTVNQAGTGATQAWGWESAAPVNPQFWLNIILGN